MHRSNALIKASLPVGLSVLYLWITIIDPFLRNGMPTGWDTGAYIGWVNSFALGGFGYVQDPNFIQFSGANLSPFLLLFGTISLARLELSGYVVFQVAILASFFLSTFMLSRAFGGTRNYTVLVFFFLVTDTAFIRMTWDLYANLLTMSFLQLALAGSVRMRMTPNRASTLAVYLFSTLMLVTDIEIGLFGILVLGASLLIGSLREHQGARDTVRVLAPVAGSLLTAAVLWLPYAQQYLSVSPVIVPVSTSLDLSSVAAELGGPVIMPFWVVGIAYMAYELIKGRNRARSSILSGWFLAFLVSVLLALAFRPTLAGRVALLLPIYFFLPEAMTLVSGAYGRIKSVEGYVKPIGILFLLCLTIGISLYSVSAFIERTGPDASSPYVSYQDYHTLSSFATYAKASNMNTASTVFLIYPSERTYDPEAVSIWANLYDNWIFATVGPHLTYYGTIENFTMHVPIPFISSNEEATFRAYSSRFAPQPSQSRLNLVVVLFLYGGSQHWLVGLSQPVPGVYVTQLRVTETQFE